jgi:hypothetical protein
MPGGFSFAYGEEVLRLSAFPFADCALSASNRRNVA